MFKYDAHKTGALSELKAQVYFTELGYDVFTPIHNKTRADFIAVKGTEIVRVQVKTAQYNGPYIQSRLSSSNNENTYTKDECDVIVFILDKRMWIAPIEEVQHFTSVCLGKVEGKYNSYKEYDPSKWEIH